jgi:hypothetical protein
VEWQIPGTFDMKEGVTTQSSSLLPRSTAVVNR